MNKLVSIIIALMLSIGMVSAITITPQKGLNLRNLFNLTNVNHIDANEICFGIDCRTNWTANLTTGDIKALGFNTTTELDTYFYSITNPNGYINASALAPYMLFTGNNSNVTQLYFNTNPIINNTPIGTLYWDATDKTLALQGEAWTLQIGQETYIIVYNDKIYPILNGRAVTQDGAIGDQPTVAYANSNDISTGIVLGVSTQTIQPGQSGMITILGIVHDLNTSAWTPDTTLYVDQSGQGILTDVKPTGTSYPMTIGQVVKQDGIDGSMFVRPRTAEVDPIWSAAQINYYNKTDIDNLIYGDLKNTSLIESYIAYYHNGTLQPSPISYQVTDEAFIDFFDDRSMYLDSTYGVGGINIPAQESHKANWQVTSKGVAGSGTVTTGAYDNILDQTPVTVSTVWGDNIDTSSNIFVNNVSYFVNDFASNTTLYVRGVASFTNQPYSIKIAPYSDVFGPSNQERGYSISDDNGNWQWAMYIPDNVNNSQLCFQNRLYPTGNLFCLHDNGDINVLGTLYAQGINLGNSSITVTQVNANVLNGTIIYLNNTDLQSIINNLYLGLDTKLNITDQRYNDTALINAVNNSALHNSGPQLLNGTLTILGNLNVIGSYVNLTVTQQDINGSIYPIISGLFDLGSVTQTWNNIYANTLYGNLNASYIQNPYWLNITDQRYNDTAAIQAVNNSLSGYLPINDQRYNDTAQIQAVNSSLQIQINTKVGGNGTNGTIPIWTSNNTLGDSPLTQLITDENDLLAYNGTLYIDDTNKMVGINVVPGTESHAQAFVAESPLRIGLGNITIIGSTFDGYSTLVTTTNILPESFVDAGSVTINEVPETVYVFSVVNTTAFRVRGTVGNVTFTSTNWTWRQAPYIDVSGPADSERGYTISSDGVWQWAMFVPDNTNNTQFCVQNRNAWFNGNNNAYCVDAAGDMTVYGNLKANSALFPRYSGFYISSSPTDNGNGSITIPANQLNCYANNDYGNVLTKYNIAGGVTGQGGIPALVPTYGQSLSYIVADCGPTGTTPTFTVLTDPLQIDNIRYQVYAEILVGNNNKVHIQENQMYGTGLPGRAFNKDLSTNPITLNINTPLALTVNNSYPMINGFSAWAGYTEYTIPAVDNLTNGRYAYGTGSNRTAIVTMPPRFNDSYYPNSNGTITNFTPGYWGIIDIWRFIENTNEIYMVAMPKEYSMKSAADAETSLVPVPPAYPQYGLYVGRIIFQNGNSSNQFAETYSPLNSYVTAQPTTNHNQLTGLQGGDGTNYEHLGLSDYNNVLNKVWQYINTTTNIQGLGFYNSTYIDSLLTGKLNITDQRYNDTILINAVNTTSNIQSLGFNTTTQLNTLYYAITNPNGYVNATGVVTAVGNWSADKVNYNNITADATQDNNLMQTFNTTSNIQSLGFNTTAQLNNLYYAISNPNGYLNATGVVTAVGNFSAANSTLARIGNCPTGQLVQNTTTGGVQCIAAGTGTVTSITFNGTGLLGGTITTSGSVALNTSYLYTLFYNISNPVGYLNATGVVLAVGNWSADKINYNNITADFANDTATFVPYTGATNNTNLGVKNLTTNGTINSRGTYSQLLNSTSGTFTMTTQNVWYNVTGLALDTYTMGTVVSGYRLNITEAGTYMIYYAVSGFINNNDDFQTRVSINGVVEQSTYAAARWGNTQGNTNSMTIYTHLNVGDVIDIQLRDISRNGAIITYTNRALSVYKIGN